MCPLPGSTPSPWGSAFRASWPTLTAGPLSRSTFLVLSSTSTRCSPLGLKLWMICPAGCLLHTRVGFSPWPRHYIVSHFITHSLKHIVWLSGSVPFLLTLCWSFPRCLGTEWSVQTSAACEAQHGFYDLKHMGQLRAERALLTLRPAPCKPSPCLVSSTDYAVLAYAMRSAQYPSLPCLLNPSYFFGVCFGSPASASSHPPLC